MFANITDFNNVNDWFYIITAVLVVDFIVILLAKYPGKNPNFKVNSLDAWYTRFHIMAVGSDVLSILIGIMFTRYIYTGLALKNPLFFIAILLLFQLFHDIVFYLGVIKPLPVGHNNMIDVFKSYSNENGAKILVADAAMMLGSVFAGSILKALPDHATVAVGFITLYSLCYILYTRKPNTE